MANPEFNPANELEQVLIRASKQPSARPEFYQKLFDSQIWLLTPETTSASGTGVLEADTEVQFVSWFGEIGDYLPIFSSLEQLQEAVNRDGNSYGFLILKGSDLFPILGQNPRNVILNPGATFGKHFVPDEIRRLADGSILRAEEQVVQKDTQVLLGQPSNYPHDLVAALQELFAKFKPVETAYLAQMHNPSSGDSPHLLIGIQCEADMRQIASAAVTVARELPNLNTVVDFVQVGGGKGPFDNYFQTQTTPFYQRAETKSRWKLW